MTYIGETLRSERTRRNLALEQISKDLKISCRMLSAIEEERFDRLPGGVFTRSFVRQYARYLGIDEEEIGSRLEQVLAPLPLGQPPGQSISPAPEPPIQLPRVEGWETLGGGRPAVWRSPLVSLGLVVVAMLACAGVYAWWQRRPHTASAQQSDPPAATLTSTSRPPAQPVAAPAQPSQSAEQPPDPPAQPSESAVAKHAEAAAATDAAAAAPVRVEMTAAEPVWVEIKSDGRTTFSGILNTNQSRTVDANTNVTLVLGNAGGVSISLNGKPIGSVGAKGQVRNVQLTSGGFEIVPPKRAVSLDDM